MASGRFTYGRRRAGALLMLMGLLTGLFATFAAVVEAAPVNPGVVGGFEIDGDQSSPPGGTIDWGDVDPTVLTDAISPDDGLQGSSKEDEPEDFVCQDKSPTVTPGKDNLVRGYINTRVVSLNSIFLDLGFVRSDGGTQGDSHVNFEFNQNPVTDLCPYVARTDGDLLITFDFPGNSGDPADVQTFTWDADAPDGPDNPGKWAAFTFTGAIAAEDNIAEITDEVVGGTIAPRAFGEASIDLVALANQIGGAGSDCLQFGFASMRSRSSGQSFSSALQDILGGPVDVTTCGKVIVHKVDDGNPASPLPGATFGLWPATATVPAVGADGTRPSTGSIDTCTSIADGTCTFNDVNPGDYKVAELTAPAGYALDPDVVSLTVGFRQTVDVAAPFVDPRDTGFVRITKAVTDGGLPFAVNPADLAGLTFVLTQGGVTVKTWPPPGVDATCSLNGVTLSCVIGPVPLGSYVVTEDPATLPDGMTQGADVNVTIDEDEETVDVTITNPLVPINIHLEKTGPNTAQIGDVIDYTFDITTTGPPLTITQLVEITEAPSYADRCDTTALSVPAELSGDGDALLEVGETWRSTCQHTVTLADATDADGALLQNKAEVTGRDSFGREVSDDDTHVVTIDLPGVSVEKSTSTPAVSAGDTVDFSITVANDGNAPATGVSFTDDLPDGVVWSFVGAAPAGCSLNLANDLVCTGLTVPALGSVTIDLAGTSDPAACPSITNPAFTVTVPDEPPHLAGDNTTLPVPISVNCPDVRVDKSTLTPAVNAGDPVSFDITITNDGLGDATDVAFSDDLPDGVVWSITGAAPAGCSLDASNNLVCSIAVLGAGQSVTIHLAGTTDRGDCPSIANPVSSVSAGNEPAGATGNNSTSAVTITVTCPAPPPPPPPPPAPVLPLAIDVVKDGPALAHRGDEITYTFTVTNTGDVALVTIVLTDPICDDGTIVLVDDGNGDTVLAVDEVWSYECTRVVTADDPDPLPNTATALGTAADGRTTTDDDDHEVDLIDPEILVVKSVDDETPDEGQTVTFTYVVTNTGDTTLFGIAVVDDQLGPIGTIDELAPGESATLTMDMVVANDSPTVNVGTATGSDVLGRSVSDNDDATITVVAGNVVVRRELPRTGTTTGRMLVAAGFLLLVGGLLTASGGSSPAPVRRRRG